MDRLYFFLKILLILIFCRLSLSVESFAAQASNVVILGSSTAQGVGADPIDSSFVNRLKAYLKSDNPGANVVNLAASGYSTYNIMPSFFTPPEGRPRPDLTRNITAALYYKPDLVIISLPTNDINYGFTDTEILSNYSVLLQILRDNKIPFLVTSTQPRDGLNAAGRLRLKDFNPKLIELCSSNFVNVFDELTTSENTIKAKYSYGDGVHLNNRGHYAVYRAVVDFPYFKNWFVNRLSVLPLVLSSFRSERANASVYLSWSTLSESNTAAFELQRSESGRNYEAIVNIKARGSSMGAVNYFYRDAVRSTGTYYYKLLLHDKDGRITVLDSTVVKGERESLGFKISRLEDFSLFVEIESGKPCSALLSIYDLSGKVLFDRSIFVAIGLNSLKIPLAFNSSSVVIGKLKTSEASVAVKTFL